MPRKAEVIVEGKQLALSNLEKVLYPATGFTKAQVIDYYIQIAPVLLPHLERRPLTLKRYPNGVDNSHFYEKQCPSHRPGWVRTTRVARSAGHIDYCVVTGLADLVWLANLADIELHPFLHREPRIDRPTSVLFDLDPGPPAGIADCCRVALRLRERLHELDLESFPKTSGSKGLQLSVPLNTPATYERTKRLACSLAESLQRDDPDCVVSRMSKDLRKDKVFVDWSQNDEHKTTISVYSLRAMEHPTVSAPLRWDEVEAGAAGRHPMVFEWDQVLERARDHGDLFAPVLTLKQKLPRVEAAR